ncbi:MAG: hypothetical protein ACREQV_20845, partial [Candidatus Binatia bacterium]
LVVSPYFAVVLGLARGLVYLWISAAVAIGMQLIFPLFFASDRRIRNLSLLLFPAGMLLISAMMLRAGYKCIKNGGIVWRGTHYPIEQLRAGQRIKFSLRL